MRLPSSKLSNFTLAAFLLEHLLLEHRTQRGVSEFFCVQLVFFQIPDSRDFFLFCEVGGDAAEFAADVGGDCPEIRVCVFILELYVLSVIISKNKVRSFLEFHRRSLIVSA